MPAKKVSYAELIGGRYFNVQLDWNKQYGNTLYAPGKAQPKKPSEYKIVGKPIKREDVAPKVFAQEDFCTDVKVPGMVHGRMIRARRSPAAVPVKVDEASIKDIPAAKVVWQNGFLGVVADKEWDAIQAMRQAQGGVVASRAAVPAAGDALRRHPQIPGAQARGRKKQSAMWTTPSRSAAKVIEAEYEWPFQSHAAMGPACALVEIKDGRVTCYTGTQKSHFVQAGLAATLGMPLENVHVKWMAGPGSYGRNDADDCRHGCRRARQGGRQAGAACNICATREPAGTPRARPRSTRPASAFDAAGNIIGLRVHQQGRFRGSTSTPMAASRTIRWPARPSA